LNQEGRIGATYDEQYAPEDGVVAHDFPEDFDFVKQSEWRIEDEKLIHDPLPKPEPAIDPSQQRMDEIEEALCELAEMIVGGGK